MQIARREVRVGDRLYHWGFGLWGEVIALDTNSARVAIQGIGGEDNTRTVFVTEGGNVNGRRQMYWHPPLALDLPVSDISKYQAAVEFAKELLA